MKRFCIIANQGKDNEQVCTKQLQAFLCEHGAAVEVLEPIAVEEGRIRNLKQPSLDAECAIVLGGDGTLLHAAKDFQSFGIPVFGINLGTLGFLTASEYQYAEEALEKLLADEYDIEKRTMLDVKNQAGIVCTGLNDVVISRSGCSRLIHLQIYVNGQLADDYKSDGVIVATPTGSTGYSLSAGGPVVAPTVHAILITPICPHALKARTLAISDEDEIVIKVLKTGRSVKEEALVTVDGDAVFGLEVDEEVTICRAKEQVAMVALRDVTFWDRVHGKL